MIEEEVLSDTSGRSGKRSENGDGDGYISEPVSDEGVRSARKSPSRARSSSRSRSRSRSRTISPPARKRNLSKNTPRSRTPRNRKHTRSRSSSHSRSSRSLSRSRSRSRTRSRSRSYTRSRTRSPSPRNRSRSRSHTRSPTPPTQKEKIDDPPAPDNTVDNFDWEGFSREEEHSRAVLLDAEGLVWPIMLQEMIISEATQSQNNLCFLENGTWHSLLLQFLAECTAMLQHAEDRARCEIASNRQEEIKDLTILLTKGTNMILLSQQISIITVTELQIRTDIYATEAETWQQLETASHYFAPFECQAKPQQVEEVVIPPVRDDPPLLSPPMELEDADVLPSGINTTLCSVVGPEKDDVASTLGSEEEDRSDAVHVYLNPQTPHRKAWEQMPENNKERPERNDEQEKWVVVTQVALTSQREALDSKAEHLHKIEVDLSRRVAEVARLQHEMIEKASLNATREENLAERERVILAQQQANQLEQQKLAQTHRQMQQHSEQAQLLSAELEARQRRLDAQEEVLAGRERRLHDWEAALGTRELATAKREATCAAREEGASRHAEQVQEQLSTLAEHQTSLARREADLRQRENNVGQLEAEWQQRAAEIQRTEHVIHKRHSELRSLLQTTEERDLSSVRTLADLDLREQQLLARQTRVGAQEEALKQREADVGEREASAVREASLLSRKRREISGKESALAELEHELEARESKLQAREAELQKRERGVAEEVRSAARKETMSLEREAEASRREREVATRERVVLVQEEQLRELESRLRQAERDSQATRTEAEEARKWLQRDEQALQRKQAALDEREALWAERERVMEARELRLREELRRVAEREEVAKAKLREADAKCLGRRPEAGSPVDREEAASGARVSQLKEQELDRRRGAELSQFLPSASPRDLGSIRLSSQQGFSVLQTQPVYNLACPPSLSASIHPPSSAPSTTSPRTKVRTLIMSREYAHFPPVH
eukprot:TRINITY_DN10334_c0_g2_i1.p1 TRINITY_DN10334_c0_g2~~TRINITY_DN10334_c0_g2_i1.p1  ORF type:complete len:966 (+),score=153.75 TRINITY_DN10334_c0_g2_i1:657-3554(+)